MRSLRAESSTVYLLGKPMGINCVVLDYNKLGRFQAELRSEITFFVIIYT